MEQKEVKWVYDTVLSAPGMEDLVKIDFRISRKTVLLLAQVIERGLQVKGNGLPESVSPDILEELRTLSGNCLEKAGMTDFAEKVNKLTIGQ